MPNLICSAYTIKQLKISLFLVRAVDTDSNTALLIFTRRIWFDATMLYMPIKLKGNQLFYSNHYAFYSLRNFAICDL